MINYSIILFGYMGVGKSYIGRKLSKEFMIDFFDLDSYIESYEKKSISDIFFERGEIYFRSIENKYLESILDKNIKYVISTGGGTPCYSNNIELIKNNKLIYLTEGENNLLVKLINKRNDIVLREELADQEFDETELRKVDVQVTRLRQKIETNAKQPQFIKTIRGKGYKLICNEI